jgi:hypothetical protein
MERSDSRNVLDRLRRKLDKLGPARTFHLALVRLLNRMSLFKILRGVLLLRVDPNFLECPARLTPGFLDEEQLRRLARDPANELDASFLNEALAKGDRCYAILDGDRLAAYGWYSRQPTRIDPPELLLGFDADYVYMYKGLTRPEYRGQRLHAIGMNRALQHYLEHGARGIISYVESTNFDSLKSCYRLGYRHFGDIYLWRVFGQYLRLYSPACRRYGFNLSEAQPRSDGWGARKA